MLDFIYSPAQIGVSNGSVSFSVITLANPISVERVGFESTQTRIVTSPLRRLAVRAAMWGSDDSGVEYGIQIAYKFRSMGEESESVSLHVKEESGRTTIIHGEH